MRQILGDRTQSAGHTLPTPLLETHCDCNHPVKGVSDGPRLPSIPEYLTRSVGETQKTRMLQSSLNNACGLCTQEGNDAQGEEAALALCGDHVQMLGV